MAKAVVRVKRYQFADIEVDIDTEDDADEGWVDATEAIHGTPAFDELWEAEEYDVVSVTWALTAEEAAHNEAMENDPQYRAAVHHDRN